MKRKAWQMAAVAACGIALAGTLYAAGARLCIRPGDVTPTPGLAATTVGLQDELLLDHTGEPSAVGAFTGTHRLKVIRQTYAVGGRHLPHQHECNEQAYYVVSGKAWVRIGQDTFRVEGGTILYIPPQTEHEIKNIGDGPLVNLLIDVTLDSSEVE